MSQTVVVMIGNSDDKLTQARWARFVLVTQQILSQIATEVHGRWHSLPSSKHQNFAMCLVVENYEKLGLLMAECGNLAQLYGQDSIAVMTGTVHFVGPTGKPPKCSSVNPKTQNVCEGTQGHGTSHWFGLSEVWHDEACCAQWRVQPPGGQDTAAPQEDPQHS